MTQKTITVSLAVHARQGLMRQRNELNWDPWPNEVECSHLLLSRLDQTCSWS